MGFIEVLPHEAADLSPAQAGGQLGVEELVPDLILPDGRHEPLQLVVVQDLLRRGLFLWQDDAVGGIPGDQVFLRRRIQSLAEDAVDTADGGAGQLVPVLRMLLLAAVLLELPVQLADIIGCNFAHRFASQMGFDVPFDVSPVALQGGGPHRGGGVLLQPAVQPLAQGHFALLPQIHVPVLLDVPVELCQKLLLTSGGEVTEDRVSVALVAHYDAALPAAVLSFSDHAVSGRSSLCHDLHLLISNTQYRNSSAISSPFPNCYQNIIICATELYGFSLCFAAQFLKGSHPAHSHPLLLRVVIRPVAQSDLLGPDFLAQLEVHTVPHRAGGRDGILLKNPAHVVDQLGGREEHIGAVVVMEVLQEELSVLVPLFCRRGEPLPCLLPVPRDLPAREIQLPQPVGGPGIALGHCFLVLGHRFGDSLLVLQ